MTAWVNYRDLGGGLAVSEMWEEKLSRKGAIPSPLLSIALIDILSKLRNVGPVGGSKLACPLA
ncbi:MAG: hypothetical protein CL794_03690 [Chloroflexi bacterium]|nr:hypothetical protein [Chloroflexota bacterium]